jgi:60 kDa SS-A/Ro ribonucleoprotein
MPNYKFFTQKSTPQTQPIRGRESEMIQGRSGGFAFDAGIWSMLRRCLLVGTAKSTYYAGKHELTDDFIEIIKQAIAIDSRKVADEILYASDGRAINNSAPIFALVFLSMGETPDAKKAFIEIFPQVVRTGSHFYEWLSYTKSLRGFGKIVKEAGRNWLSQDCKKLAYQLLKYQQRQGFSHRDALRLFHLKPPTDLHNELFKWVIKGWDEIPNEIPNETLAQIWWYEWLKRNPDQTHKAISEGHLTHEMAAPVGKMDQQAWQLLFNEMPIGAMLRNLGSLTEIGVLRADEPKNLDRIEEVLNNTNYLLSGRIHPIDALKALKTYQSGGSIGRSKKTWTPVARIVNILEKTVELCFDTQKPTGKVFMHAVDVSGSMSCGVVDSVGLSYCEIATTMALVTAKAEKNYVIRGFATDFRDLNITAKDSFSSALTKTSNQNFGGTDASVAYDWMIKHKFKADVVCFWTDSESWAGKRHPSQALAEYRHKINPNIKAVYVTLAPYRLTLVDPKDPLSWDLGGFDPGVPRLIQMLANDDI